MSRRKQQDGRMPQIRVYGTTHREIKHLAADLGGSIADAVDYAVKGARERLAKERQEKE